MASSTDSLRNSLYLEHLEEASALYEQRGALQDDPELPWSALAAFEERMEAHLDALTIGGQHAAQVCLDRAIDGDVGELFAAVCVFCRQRQVAAVAEVLRSLDDTEPLRTKALRDALKYELPAEWRDFCARAVATGDQTHWPVLAHVLAYRRLAPRGVLRRGIANAVPAVLPSLLWSIGRTGDREALPLVAPLVAVEDREVSSAAFRAAIRLDDGDGLNSLVASAGLQVDSIGIGLAGGPNLVPLLLRNLAAGDRAAESVTALALLGDLSAVRPLVSALSVETLADAAAEALQVITGAPLVVEAMVPEEMTEDEMFPDEWRTFRETGELPRRPDGEPFGTRVRRVTSEPAVWQEWLTANASHFTQGYRYRFGHLYTPRILFDCLRSEMFPKAYRPWVAEELLIRYRIDVPVEPDMFVAEQRRLLRNAVAVVNQATEQVEAGQWYLAGRLLS